MMLKECCRYGFFDFSFNCLLDNIGLTFAPGHQNDFAGIHNSAYSHGDSSLGNVLFAKKVACGIQSCHPVQTNQTSFATQGGTRFVKANVPGPTDTQHLNIDATNILDFFFVVLTVLSHFLHGKVSIGNMDVVWLYVNMIEQVFVHKSYITVDGVGFHWKVLVQVKSDHIFEAQSSFFMELDQVIINLYRRGACCQT